MVYDARSYQSCGGEPEGSEKGRRSVRDAKAVSEAIPRVGPPTNKRRGVRPTPQNLQKELDTFMRPSTLGQLVSSPLGSASYRNRTVKDEMRENLLPVSYTHLRAHETPEHLVC